jgi:glutamyl-tRNA synthetase
MEDTDRSRFVPGAIETYCRSLKTVGIIPDEGVWINDADEIIEKGDAGPYLQSKRKDKHQAYAKELIEKGLAYPCFCTEERLAKMREKQHEAHEPTRYDRMCRMMNADEVKKRLANNEEHVVRLAIPEDGSITFQDEIRDDVTFDWKEIDDQVIIKSDGMPTYHLAATCDDHDMRITHVIRGEEWLSSTPKHIFIYQSFGWDVPKFVHLPLLLNKDRSKLSKRQGDVAVEDYLNKGYLPEALLNFVALLGWNPTGDREIYSHKELQDMFDLKKVNKSGAVVNFEKLDWLNSHYLKQKSDDDFLSYVKPELDKLTSDDDLQTRIATIIRDRVEKLSDVQEAAEDLVSANVELDANSIPWKTQEPGNATEKLLAVKELVLLIPQSDWNSPEILEEKIKTMIADHEWSNGEVLWPLRVALSGKKQSPPPFDLLYVFGHDLSLKRIDKAIETLGR